MYSFGSVHSEQFLRVVTLPREILPGFAEELVLVDLWDVKVEREES